MTGERAVQFNKLSLCAFVNKHFEPILGYINFLLTFKVITIYKSLKNIMSFLKFSQMILKANNKLSLTFVCAIVCVWSYC